MKRVKTWLNVLLYSLLALILFFQVLAIVGVLHSDVDAIRQNTLLIPIWIAAILLLLTAFVLYQCGIHHERRLLLAALFGIGGVVLALIVALTLGAALPEQAAATNINSGGTHGLTGWRLFSRHYSPVLLGAALVIVSLIRHVSLRTARIAQENADYEERFDFDANAPTTKKKA